MTVSDSRLISSFEVVDGANTIVLNEWDGGAGTWTATITPGTYWFSDDGTSDDFIEAFNTAMDTIGGSWGTYINHVTVTSSAVAPGRLWIGSYMDSWTIDVSASTFPLRTLGLDDSGGDISDDGMGSVWSDWVHRYGWYPQDATLIQDIRKLAVTNVYYTSARYLDGVDDGEYETIHIGFDRIHPALCCIYDATLASTTDLLLNQSDPNCAFEQWALDLARDTTRRWRWYPEIDDEETYKGPYAFSDQSTLWFDALLSAPITENAGKRRTVIVDGIEAQS